VVYKREINKKTQAKRDRQRDSYRVKNIRRETYKQTEAETGKEGEFKSHIQIEIWMRQGAEREREKV